MSTGSPQPVREDLTDLFEPGSVAVIGASDEPGNLGGRAVRLLRKFNYPGQIWPVNPRRASVAELVCFPNVRDLPGRASLAIITVAGARVPSHPAIPGETSLRRS